MIALTAITATTTSHLWSRWWRSMWKNGSDNIYLTSCEFFNYVLLNFGLGLIPRQRSFNEIAYHLSLFFRNWVGLLQNENFAAAPLYLRLKSANQIGFNVCSSLFYYYMQLNKFDYLGFCSLKIFRMAIHWSPPYCLLIHNMHCIEIWHSDHRGKVCLKKTGSDTFTPYFIIWPVAGWKTAWIEIYIGVHIMEI